MASLPALPMTRQPRRRASWPAMEPDGAGGAGDEDGLAGLGVAEVEEADVGGEAGAAEGAEVVLGMGVGGVELFEGGAGGGEDLAPAEAAADEVAGGEVGVAGVEDAADGAAVADVVELPGVGVAWGVAHAAAHVRVDGHPEVADEDVAVGGLGVGGADEAEVGGVGEGVGAVEEADFAWHGWLLGAGRDGRGGKGRLAGGGREGEGRPHPPAPSPSCGRAGSARPAGVTMERGSRRGRARGGVAVASGGAWGWGGWGREGEGPSTGSG